MPFSGEKGIVMSKAGWVYWLLAIIATLFGLMGLVDWSMTITRNEAYLGDFPPEMIDWVLALPQWRLALWAITVISGLAGGVFLLLRRAWAGPAWMLNVLTMIAGLGHDLLLTNGFEMYGLGGTAFSFALILASGFFWWWSARAKSRGLLQ
jgi:hypothetical protein